MRKDLFPIGFDIGFLQLDADLVVKFRDPSRKLVLAEDATIARVKNLYCLRLDRKHLSVLQRASEKSVHVFMIFEGSAKKATLILRFQDTDERLFEELEEKWPNLRLESYDLPPIGFTVVDGADIRGALYSLLSTDQELFSLRAQRFLKTPHILTHLFSHVMSLESKDHINYISTLKVVSDNLLELLEPQIVKIEKNHNELWSQFYGESVSFVDGGMSRIVSLPGTEPMGIRVGIYTVIPGERDPQKREQWKLQSYVIGDVVGA